MNRFYKNEYPNVDDVVYVKVTKQIEAGFYVELLEYNNLEAFISLGEVTRRKKWIKKAIGIGRRQPLTVLQIDKDKKYVDLSKRRLNKEEEKQCVNIYYVCKKFLSLTNTLYDLLSEQIKDLDMKDFFDHTLWNLYKDYRKEELEELYPKILINPMLLLEYYNEKYPDQVKNVCDAIKKRVKVVPYLYHGEFRLLSKHSDGVNQLKKLFEDAMIKTNTKTVEIVAPPIYQVVVSGNDSKECVKQFNTFTDYLKKKTDEDKYLSFTKTDKLKEITKMKVSFK